MNIISKCFDRMEDSLRYNICNLQSPLIFNKDVPDLDERIVKHIPSFLKYTCCNWAYHLRDVSYSQMLCNQLRLFAYDQLLFWFEILSLTETFYDRAETALSSAIQWIGVSISVL